ncbi:MAG: hypothetical protein CMM62_10605 [Rhodospirillaceae bacterium]|nr:hypothetical protein [Rhodospirillaceae bacterium]MAX64608.1 hypothetical protein [Rhodospirillaceae bacterium]MBB58518.1 hypothetical protein [Rhodospirillaceae bacterium]|tara:strand:+ start:1039 stop:1818 length:780 start_codon:yes stop_codon:yes gene_type:complete
MKKWYIQKPLRAVMAVVVVLGVLLVGPATVLVADDARLAQSWRSARSDSAGIAPLPAQEPEAVIQVYAARTFGWRGAFAVHTWIATKRPNADQYQTHHVIGWRSGNKVISRWEDPDRYWYGSMPDLILDLRGDRAAELIDAVEAAVASYPYPNSYTAWPGPNSNTFIAWIGREVPQLQLEMPPHAVGKDYLGGFRLVDWTPSGTGAQVSLMGVLGMTLALDEGAELNLLGLTIGLDPQDMNLKLPGIGRVGPMPDPRRE